MSIYRATALGFGAFCARYFKKQDGRKRDSYFMRTCFQKNHMSCLIGHLVCQTQEGKSLKDKRNTVKEKLVVTMLRISVTELEIQKTYAYWELEKETLIFCFRINYNIRKDFWGATMSSPLA